jgi:hypothetical protein
MTVEIVLDDSGEFSVPGLRLLALSWVFSGVMLRCFRLRRGSEEGSFLSGHGFSHAANATIETPAIAAGETADIQRLKPHFWKPCAARLKTCPDTNPL